MNKILSIFIINILFLINPSVGYSQWQYWCSDGEYYKMWTGCTNNNEQLLYNSFLGDFQAVQSLLKAGADVNHQNKFGKTALMFASLGERLDVVRELIKAGADVNLQDNRGWTALGYAYYRGHLEIVEVLIEAGATKYRSRSY